MMALMLVDAQTSEPSLFPSWRWHVFRVVPMLPRRRSFRADPIYLARGVRGDDMDASLRRELPLVEHSFPLLFVIR
jgi:hypothetical protein